MADDNAPTPSPAPVTPPTGVKKGIYTSEFWLSVAATLLSALFASDIIPTGDNVWTKVAAIAATILGALGYTVVRGNVKAAAKTLLVLVLVGSMAGCACFKISSANYNSQSCVIARGAVDCTKAQGPVLEQAVFAFIASYLSTHSADIGALLSAGVAAGLGDIECFVAKLMESPPPQLASSPHDMNLIHATTQLQPSWDSWKKDHRKNVVYRF